MISAGTAKIDSVVNPTVHLGVFNVQWDCNVVDFGFMLSIRRVESAVTFSSLVCLKSTGYPQLMFQQPIMKDNARWVLHRSMVRSNCLCGLRTQVCVGVTKEEDWHHMRVLSNIFGYLVPELLPFKNRSASMGGATCDKDATPVGHVNLDNQQWRGGMNNPKVFHLDVGAIKKEGFVLRKPHLHTVMSFGIARVANNVVEFVVGIDDAFVSGLL